MTVSEDWDSFAETLNSEGWTVTRKYKCTFDEWHNREGYDINSNLIELPTLGSEYPWNYELTVSNIDVAPIKAKANQSAEPVDMYIQLTYTYSTNGAADRQKRADQAAGWKVHIDMETDVVEVGKYYNMGTAADEKWLEKYKEAHPDITDDTTVLSDIPPLIQVRYTPVATLVAYGSTLYHQRILDYVGKINSDNFLGWVLEQKTINTLLLNNPNNPPSTDLAGNFDDKELWVLAAADIEDDVRPGVAKYNFRFIYKTDGWQNDYGVATNRFLTFSIKSLLTGLNSYNDEASTAFG